MTTAEIKDCKCKTTKPDTAAEFHDQTYGVGQRVHSVTSSKTGSKVATCTVCGAKK